MRRLRSMPLPALLLLFALTTGGALLLLVAYNPSLHTTYVHRCFSPNVALPDCYAKYYTAHATASGVAGAITALKDRSARDPILYANCHNTMHALGRVAFQEYGSLPIAFQHADYFCWSGYYHGVVEGALRGVREEQIAKETLFDLCRPTDTMPAQSFDQFNCMHGIGHALMYMTNNNVPRSLTRCDDLPNDWSTQHCATGVFMENSLADGTDHKSEYLPTTDLHYPCTIVDKKFGEACYVVQSSIIMKRMDGDFANAFAFCHSIATQGYRTQCARGLGKEAAQRAFYDHAVAAQTCEHAPAELIGDCFFGAIGDIEGQSRNTDTGAVFCNAVSLPLRPTCAAIIGTTTPALLLQ